MDPDDGFQTRDEAYLPDPRLGLDPHIYECCGCPDGPCLCGRSYE